MLVQDDEDHGKSVLGSAVHDCDAVILANTSLLCPAAAQREYSLMRYPQPNDDPTIQDPPRLIQNNGSSPFILFRLLLQMTKIDGEPPEDHTSPSDKSASVVRVDGTLYLVTF